MSIVNIEKRLDGTSRCYYRLVIKKYIDAIFFANPLVLIIFATIVCYFLDIHYNSFIFEGLTNLFALCIIVTIPGLIDSFLSNYSKKSAWLIVFISFIALIAIMKFIPNESFTSLFYIIIFISFFIYLLLPPFKGIFNLVKKIPWKFVKRFVAYIERLFSPSFLFPLKLVTYSSFYILIFLIKTPIELGKLVIDAIKFSFYSYRNFLKSILILGVILYLVTSMFVIVDYIRTQYGYYGKFLCSYGTPTELKKSVVRIVGGYSEGTGFFISENQILTNFHVIAGEPSPKIIFPDGNFITPTKITGDSQADLAILFTENSYPDLVMPLPDEVIIKDEEPLLATGYAMGTDLAGKATVLRGNFADFRSSKYETVEYIQTSISLVEGMSGGPLTDQCGDVVGVNTQGLAGLSLFISADEAKKLIPDFSDQEIEKIEVDASKSPEDAVFAFYTYLKARRMKDGFELLSSEYLQKTNFEEWTNRFTDILDVTIFKSERLENSIDTAEVKFVTKNWVNQETDFHFYEGTWQTVFEDGVYKMLKSNIKEIEGPDWLWFYE